MKVRAIEGLAELEALTDTWGELVTQAGLDPLCNSPAWVLAHARAWSKPEDAYGWYFEDNDGQPIGLVPLRTEPKRKFFSLRRATLLQDGTFDSDYLDLPVLLEHRAEVLAELVRLLAKSKRAEAFMLTCVPDDSPTWPILDSYLEKSRTPSHRVPEGCAAATLPGTWEDYVAGLKKRMRSKVRALIRQAESTGAELHWCDDEAQLDQHLEQFFDLHQARWQAAGEPGSFADPKRRQFFGDLAQNLQQRGELRLARLELEGEPVAYQYGARVETSYYQLQEGFDPAREEEKVGNVLRALVIQSLIEERTETYDFMAGLSRHKSDWGGSDRPGTSIAFPVRGLRAKLAYKLRESREGASPSVDDG